MVEKLIDNYKKKIVCLLASFRRDKAKIKKRVKVQEKVNSYYDFINMFKTSRAIFEKKTNKFLSINIIEHIIRPDFGLWQAVADTYNSYNNNKIV